MAKPWLDDQTISENTSRELLARAQDGDGVAAEALMGRYLVRLQRWAAGRVPSRVRPLLDTDDVVQDALLGTIRRLDGFVPRHDGALMAYLRESVWNRLRAELRRRRLEIDDAADAEAQPTGAKSPLEEMVGRARLESYERALQSLDEDDRAAIVGRFEMGYSYAALARALDRPSADAARKAVERAVRRLALALASSGH